jgi:UDP-4-amino-4,6-dideoxy-N-acetyl-beta-L-altrosamine transaminase
MIPYGRQEITDADIEAVTAVLRSDWLTQGPAVPAFEAAVANYCGAAHAVAVNSATSALHLACLALGVGPGDCVWTSPITFVASANCALYCHATVDFVDIDPETCNIGVKSLADKLEIASAAGTLPKALVVVHLAGEPCDMEAIHALSCQYGFRIIEDASHAIGARYRDEPVGNCRYSDITIFSFHPVKIVTTGEGGMAVCQDASLAARMALLRSHGITRDPANLANNDGPWYYEQIDLGFNYRMTDIQAALGVSQMKRVDSYIACRQRLARRYDELLADFPVDLPRRDSYNISAMHLYVIRLRLADLPITRLDAFNGLRERGIGVNLHYIPVPSQPYYQRLGFSLADYPQAGRYYKQAISLPLYATLTESDQDRVVAALREILGVIK